MGTCSSVTHKQHSDLLNSHFMPSYLPLEPQIDDLTCRIISESWDLAMSTKAPGFILLRSKQIPEQTPTRHSPSSSCHIPEEQRCPQTSQHPRPHFDYQNGSNSERHNSQETENKQSGGLENQMFQRGTEPENETPYFNMGDDGSRSSPAVLFYDTFYDRLFQTIPEIKDMFSTKRHLQGRMLAKMFSTIVAHVETKDRVGLTSTMETIAHRHNERGVLPYHYAVCGEVLFFTLHVMLQEEYTPGVHNAWVNMYGVMMKTVIPIVVQYHYGNSATKPNSNTGLASPYHNYTIINSTSHSSWRHCDQTHNHHHLTVNLQSNKRTYKQ